MASYKVVRRNQRRYRAAKKRMADMARAIALAGTSEEEFFSLAQFAVQVPMRFSPAREAARFKCIVEEGFDDHPNYKPPACIVHFVSMVSAMQDPQRFMDMLRQSAQSMLIPSSSESAAIVDVVHAMPRSATQSASVAA